ncbi:uncharacterized protein LOC107262104 [Ricinus communis]|uniref:uncharacterized protein LOC107262104 n=1 Tax=Ricinus communis TaxID=3988 RepID=UPI0007721A82|nr:uncharacterized protein LOC107262104 [Ricinus communis]|eukprot:XP_015581295.1 uncharacterized protein LOC107262104 [Ricinus communis]
MGDRRLMEDSEGGEYWLAMVISLCCFVHYPLICFTNDGRVSDEDTVIAGPKQRSDGDNLYDKASNYSRRSDGDNLYDKASNCLGIFNSFSFSPLKFSSVSFYWVPRQLVGLNKKWVPGGGQEWLIYFWLKGQHKTCSKNRTT